MSQLTLDPAYALPSTDGCPWMDIAMKEMGTKEKKGAGSNKEVLKYLRSCDANNASKGSLDDDATDWCSAFVNWCMGQAGYPGTRHVRARSWLRWGLGFEITEPRFGCITVFTRVQKGGKWDTHRGTHGKGHVAFLWKLEGDTIFTLGGNQRPPGGQSQVCLKGYKTAQKLMYLWPSALALQPSTSYLTPPSRLL